MRLVIRERVVRDMMCGGSENWGGVNFQVVRLSGAANILFSDRFPSANDLKNAVSGQGL